MTSSLTVVSNTQRHDRRTDRQTYTHRDHATCNISCCYRCRIKRGLRVCLLQMSHKAWSACVFVCVCVCVCVRALSTAVSYAKMAECTSGRHLAYMNEQPLTGTDAGCRYHYCTVLYTIVRETRAENLYFTRPNPQVLFIT